MDPFASASAALRALRSRKLGALELLDAQLARLERWNGKLNAIVWTDLDRARDAARALDVSPASYPQPLRGLPMTVKESFDLAGAPSTWGMPALKDNVARTDSVVVERLRRAGAVVFGKTNVPFGLGDLQSYNEIYGSTGNPWDLSRTPGGSSGGSAAALAAGMSSLEVGSDLAGSIRNPAHYCGVFGHKPTWGLIPVRGHAPPGAVAEPDIAVVGPLARSAADLDLALDVLAGPDALDPGVRFELPRFRGTKHLRVALWTNDATAPVARAVEQRVRDVGRAFADLGASVSDARPDFDAAHGHRVFGALLQAFVSAGLPALPVAATSAFLRDEGPMEARRIDVDGEPQSHYQQMFWAGPAGVAQLPSTVVPTGPDAQGLPIGLQLVGPAWGDRITIGAAAALEAAGFEFRPPPGY